jgi:ribonuclease BN (tRNA processing enzyme)
MTDHLLAAYQADIQERLVGLEPANSTGYQVQAHDVGAGPIYEDDRVKVEGFSANHGSWPALSYRFITPAGVIVISGDTAPYEGIIDQYQGCDILVHEVYSETGWQGHSTPWQQYHARMHTSTGELASIANAVKPALLVLSHQLYWGQSEEGLLQEIKAHYRGAVVSAKDLDVFELDARTIVSAG